MTKMKVYLKRWERQGCVGNGTWFVCPVRISSKGSWHLHCWFTASWLKSCFLSSPGSEYDSQSSASGTMKGKMNMNCMSTRKSLLKYSFIFCIDALNTQLHRRVIRKYESLSFCVWILFLLPALMIWISEVAFRIAPQHEGRDCSYM